MLFHLKLGMYFSLVDCVVYISRMFMYSDDLVIDSGRQILLVLHAIAITNELLMNIVIACSCIELA
jgi:hypothetical protein